MRKMCDSSKTRPTASLIVWAVARSVPMGFSSTTRERSVARPTWSRCSQIAPKSAGATAR